MSDLSPCPWCGHARIVGPFEDAGELYMICDGCGMDGPCGLTEAEAIAAWNTRPLPTPDDLRRLADSLPEPEGHWNSFGSGYSLAYLLKWVADAMDRSSGDPDD